MCGFLGHISKNTVDINSLISANSIQTCRGPDETIFLQNSDVDFLKNSSLSSAFIFNRLSIVDLSNKASQPMINTDFETLLMFNGEIYNHRALRKELTELGLNFKSSHSDSEVVLNGLSYFGIKFVNKLIGQFSIFFLDSLKNQAYLARDRLGQKPLFYKLENEDVIFSSNLKALVNASNDKTLASDQIINYINYGVVPSPNTIFKNCYKLMPGEVIKINLNNFEFRKSIYWDPINFVDNKKFDFDYFVNLFEDAVNIRLDADVPLAAFVSGGLDSTAIVKAVNNKESLNSFSMNFKNEKYNEQQWSSKVSETYKTIHTETFLDINMSRNEIVKIINSQDEPFADISYIPTYILSKEISKNFKVAISGDGGDELLFGYTRSNKELLKKSGYLPGLANELFFKIYPGFLGSGNTFSSNFNNVNASYPSYFNDQKLLNLLNIHEEFDLTNYLSDSTNDVSKKLSLFEYKYYLSELMLLKIDRASMSNSLEVRSPFVDHRLVELIMSSDSSYIDVRNPKKIIKKYLENDFSSEFLNRKKMGFSFDVETWVYNNTNFIHDTLNSGNIIFNMDKKILKNLSYRKSRINSHRIWKLFLLETYLKGFE